MSSLLEDSFIAAPTPGGAAGPAHAAHDVEICGVPTKIALTAYSNRVFVVVTQTDNLGTLIAAERDLAIDPTCTCYSTRVLLGRRDDETLEVYARTMVELVAKRFATDAPPLLLAISIKEHSPETFKAVMKFVEEHRVWWRLLSTFDTHSRAPAHTAVRAQRSGAPPSPATRAAASFRA